MLKLIKFYIYFKSNSTNSVEGCMTLDQAWSKVGTLPELPVELGTNLDLLCDSGYSNLGGNAATCMNGQVVPDNEIPDCRGEQTLFAIDTRMMQKMRQQIVFYGNL